MTRPAHRFLDVAALRPIGPNPERSGSGCGMRPGRKPRAAGQEQRTASRPRMPWRGAPASRPGTAEDVHAGGRGGAQRRRQGRRPGQGEAEAPPGPARCPRVRVRPRRRLREWRRSPDGAGTRGEVRRRIPGARAPLPRGRGAGGIAGPGRGRPDADGSGPPGREAGRSGLSASPARRRDRDRVRGRRPDPRRGCRLPRPATARPARGLKRALLTTTPRWRQSACRYAAPAHLTGSAPRPKQGFTGGTS